MFSVVTLSRSLPVFIPLGLIGLWRWGSFTVRALSAVVSLVRGYWCPKYRGAGKHRSTNFTLVIATIDAGPELSEALESWMRNRPAQIIFATINLEKSAISQLVRLISERVRSDDQHGHACELPDVIVTSVQNPNKRGQMVAALNLVKTEFIVFVDDDAIWPPTLLEEMCKAFQDPRVGGLGTEQCMRPSDTSKGPTMWEIFADFRLTAKTMENACAMFLGNAVTCLSGRTAAYRTCIFKPTDQKGPGNPYANCLFGFRSDGFHPSHFIAPDAETGSPDAIHQDGDYDFEVERAPNEIALQNAQVCTRLYTVFCTAFVNDLWKGQHLLVSGDDKFLTRWLVTHGWQMHILFGSRARIQTTFKRNWLFLKQYLRWTRNTWRSDFRSIFIERSVWKSFRDYYILIFLMVDKMIAPLTLLFGPVLIAVLVVRMEMDCGSIGSYHIRSWNVVLSFVLWVCVTRAVRILPHFFSRPRHIICIPAFVALSYLLAILKIYCLFTLNRTGWNTRNMGSVPTASGGNQLLKEGIEPFTKSSPSGREAELALIRGVAQLYELRPVAST